MLRPEALSSLGLVAAASLLAMTGCARKPHAVVCHVSYGGEEWRLEFSATANPYVVKPVDVAGRFRFKVIYLREPWNAAAVNVYAYQQTDGADALLQEGKYGPPFLPVSDARYGFTGRQLVYSREQRELDYWCELSP